MMELICRFLGFSKIQERLVQDLMLFALSSFCLEHLLHEPMLVLLPRINHVDVL